jgi:site-specific recombinase XerD
MTAAGISRNITFHSFRHTFATLQLSAGTDIYTVSKLLGHKAVATTQIYAHVLDEAKRDAVNRITIDFNTMKP